MYSRFWDYTWIFLAQGTLLPMWHSIMLARTGVGLQAAWDRTPQHDQFPTSNYSLLRGNVYNVFLGPEHTDSHMAQWRRRRACDHPVSRSSPDIGFFIFHLYIFHRTPHWRARARTSIRFQYLWAVDLFAEDACFLETCFLETCFLETNVFNILSF